MGAIAAIIIAIANYAATAAAVVQTAIKIGEEVEPIASMLWDRITAMTAEARGPTEQETAELDALMQGYDAKLSARAAEAQAKIDAEP